MLVPLFEGLRIARLVETSNIESPTWYKYIILTFLAIVQKQAQTAKKDYIIHPRGIQPALSYAFGAGNHRRMDRIVRGTGLATVLTGLVLSALFLLFRDSWLPGFLADPQVVAMGKRMLWGVLCAAPFFGLYQISSCYLQSTGNVGAATFVSLLRQGILYIPALYGMNLLGGLTGLIFAGAVSDLLSTGLAVLLGLARRRKMVREEEAVPLLPGLEKL